MGSPNICRICREPYLSNYSTIFQKRTDGINEVSRPKSDNFTVRPGMYVHVSCRKNYVRTRGVNSSSAEVSYRKPRTSSGELNFGKDCFYCGCVFTEREREREREREKLRNHVISLVRTERLIKQSIKLSLTEQMMSGALTLKDGMLV